jgi:hypothetical protein
MLDDVVWNARFHDVVHIEGDGSRIVDYTRFHDVVSIEGS